jgi:hypothetical protein
MERHNSGTAMPISLKRRPTSVVTICIGALSFALSSHAALAQSSGARSAGPAGRAATSRAPPVAVVDFVLADGTSSHLQTVLRRKHIPFVVVSAYPRALVRAEPGQEVLQKPVASDLLRDRVRAACKRAA